MYLPLSSRIRPEKLEGIKGQETVVKLLSSFLERGFLPSMIFFGPPGCGKTTVARIVASEIDASFHQFSAVNTSVQDIKKILYNEKNSIFAKQQIVFIDELHRFNKAQQDIFLPMIEDDGVIFIGATTENPSFSVNNALISRARAIRFIKTDKTAVTEVLNKAKSELEANVSEELIELLAENSNGDIRYAVNTLESAYMISQNGLITLESIKEVVTDPEKYDKKGDFHYRYISAFIKSMRGSDPDASLYYLSAMLAGGEDPLFLLRRMIIFASEDIGNADPRALQVAVSALHGFKDTGFPEGKIILAHAVTYLATAPKSNASYLAGKKAEIYIAENGSKMPPQNIINNSSLEPGEEKGNYKYPHDYPNHYVEETYLPESVDKNIKFYDLSDVGYEAKIKNYRKNIGCKKI